MNGCGSSWFVGPFQHITQRLPAGPFGSMAAIAPNFDDMAPAEKQAAILLMREGGADDKRIARLLGRTQAGIRAMAQARYAPVQNTIGMDLPESRAASGLLARPVSKPAYDRAIDTVLKAIDAHRAKAGSAPDARFEMTMDDVARACGFGNETARRRIKELERRTWLARTLRPGLPPLVLIAPAGRSRLEALAMEEKP